jgi:Uma2 family endonuclease
MATVHDPTAARSAPRSRQGPKRWKWTSEQYHRLANLGFFRDRKVELVAGELWVMSTNPPHETAVWLATQLIPGLFGAGFAVRAQMSLDLGRHNQPEPDIAVVRGHGRDFASAHPTTAVLIMEVSDSTLCSDRRLKAHTYARVGIEDYWILNLVDRQLEIHRRPGPDPDRRGRFRYADVTIVAADGEASPLAAPHARVRVADLLP